MLKASTKPDVEGKVQRNLSNTEANRAGRNASEAESDKYTTKRCFSSEDLPGQEN